MIMSSNAYPRFLIVVLAYNRPTSLRRLLDSVEKVESAACRADLLVSVDGGGDPECEKIASSVRWRHGKYDIFVNKSRLGLKEHVESATDRVIDYDAVIMLEDDLSVSPWMLAYSVAAFSFYGKCADVAQVSLYCHRVNEFTGLPLIPAESPYDTWFARVPSSWGQMYTRKQWLSFRDWQMDQPSAFRSNILPSRVYSWKHTWKRGFFEYVSVNRLWVVYPYRSLTTNHGLAGTNYSKDVADINVTVQLCPRNYLFTNPCESNVLYDEWFEPLPETLGLDPERCLNVTVDLSGRREISVAKNQLLLSTRPCSDPLEKFSADFVPLEYGLRLGWDSNSEDVICLGKVENFDLQPLSRVRATRQVPSGIRAFLFSEGANAGRNEVRSSIRYRIGTFAVLPWTLVKWLWGMIR